MQLLPDEIVFAARAGGEAVRAALLQRGEVVELASGRLVRVVDPTGADDLEAAHDMAALELGIDP